MRKITVDPSEDPVTSDLLFALQLRAANEPLLPRLKSLHCDGATEAFIPLIPLLLSPQTVWIKVIFAKGSPAVMIASMIVRLPDLCPDLTRITLDDLPREPLITEAVSEMLLACNRDALQWFCVDSPLTEEARQVVYQLPRLSNLWAIIQEHTLLPVVTLPNLNSIDIEYGDHLDWLQGFRGAALEKLESVVLSSESDQIGNFLEEFESVALTTSVPATLSTFEFTTWRPWNPNYRSLLPFTQMVDLSIWPPCHRECSSRVDDNIITDLARAMPKLEILGLGGEPCRTPTGVTVKGLITLARGCRHLTNLRIHFQTASLADAASSQVVPPPSENATTIRQQDCALTDLDVGWTPILEGSQLAVALTLLQIFPHLNIKYMEGRWRAVSEDIELSRRISAFVRCTGEAR